MNLKIVLFGSVFTILLVVNFHSISAVFVKCNTLSSNKNIDGTAKCGAGVTFSSTQTQVSKNVVIGAGSKFLYGLNIGMGTTLGENINAGNNVVIGEQVCVENGVNLIAKTDIKDFVKVIRAKKGFTVVDEKDGFKYVLKGGKCSLIKRIATDLQIDSNGFFRCQDNGNTYVKPSVAAKCRPRATLSSDNIILGKLRLDDDAQFGVRNTVEDDSEIFVGAGSKVNNDCTLHGRVRIGIKSTIGSQTTLRDAAIKNKVTVGIGSHIVGTLEDGAIIGHDCFVGTGAVVEAGAEMGASSQLGNGARLAAKLKLGSKCCVGYNAKVAVNMPDKYYVNAGEKPKQGFAVLVNGRCTTATDDGRKTLPKASDNSKQIKLTDDTSKGYTVCKVRNSYFEGVAMCKKKTVIYGNNLIRGDLYLGTSATFSGDCIGDSSVKIVVGDGTTVGKNCHFVDVVLFGKTNKIGGGSSFSRCTTGDGVKIGTHSNISGTIRDKAILGNNCRTGLDSIVGVGAIMGDNSMLGSGSTLMAGRKLGTGSCVAYGMRVRIDIPPGCLMNIEGKFRKVAKGKKASLVSGLCTES